MKNFLPASLLCDFYKVAHKDLYPKGTEVIYSTFTPRSNKYFPIANEVVVFGIQGFIKKYLINYFNEYFFTRNKEDVVAEYERAIKFTLGEQYVDSTHIGELHDLGYLPIKIKALKEGTLAPIKVPVLTIENTNPKFFWLTNYLETLISTEIWQPMTSATISHQYRKLLDEYSIKTTGNTDGVGFQAHDFSLRGMSSLESGMASGAGHLISFTGTDTIPAIIYLEEYYNANIENELVASSIPATEHSIMSAGTSADGERDEYDTFKRIITEIHPNGFVSIVSDTYDFWKVVTETLPQLKEEIINRDGRLVIRPDSGNPVDILCGKKNYDVDLTKYFDGDIKNLEDDIYDLAREWASNDCEGAHNCGGEEYTVKFKVEDKIYLVKVGFEYNRHDKTYYYIDNYSDWTGVQWDTLKELEVTAEDKGLIECLWNTFGGTVSEQGYKVLDSHIGAIYGDSITLELAKQICERLEAKGFASTNVVFGVGSYTFQYNTRDTFGFAMKATYAETNGESKLLFKDPKTDDGTKRSQRGRVIVFDNGDGIQYQDGLSLESEGEVLGADNNLLETVFEDGKLIRDQSLSEIRDILKNQ